MGPGSLGSDRLSTQRARAQPDPTGWRTRNQEDRGLERFLGELDCRGSYCLTQGLKPYPK